MIDDFSNNKPDDQYLDEEFDDTFHCPTYDVWFSWSDEPCPIYGTICWSRRCYCVEKIAAFDYEPGWESYSLVDYSTSDDSYESNYY